MTPMPPRSIKSLAGIIKRVAPALRIFTSARFLPPPSRAVLRTLIRVPAPLSPHWAGLFYRHSAFGETGTTSGFGGTAAAMIAAVLGFVSGSARAASNCSSGTSASRCHCED